MIDEFARIIDVKSYVLEFCFKNSAIVTKMCVKVLLALV